MLLMDLWHMLLSFLDDPLAAASSLPIISHTRLGNDGKGGGRNNFLPYTHFAATKGRVEEGGAELRYLI